MNSKLRDLSVLAIVLIAPVAVLLLRAAYGDSVPDPLPTHWNLHGQVNGTTGLDTFTAVALVGTLVGSLIAASALVRIRRHPALGQAAVFGTWLAWLLASVFATVMLAANGASTPGAVSLGAGYVVAMVAVPLAVAALVQILAPSPRRVLPDARRPASPMGLRPGERAVWIGHASSWPMLVIAGVLVVVALALAFVVQLLALAAVLGAVVLTWAHVLTVRVDNDAVTVGWGPLRWPRVSVPMATVTAAHVADIEPLAWGGWGYRTGPTRRAAIARRGTGLVLTCGEHRPFAVTVDQPHAGMDLVNALVSAPSRPGPASPRRP